MIEKTTKISNFHTKYSNKSEDTLKNKITLEEDLEEDKLFYERHNLSKEGIKFGSKEFDEYKKRLRGFPPATAPGNVRKAWRESIKNLSLEDKKTIFAICTVIDTKMQNNKDIQQPNDIKGYLDLCNVLKGDIEKLSPFITQREYRTLFSTIDKFKNQLQKYNLY